MVIRSGAVLVILILTACGSSPSAARPQQSGNMALLGDIVARMTYVEKIASHPRPDQLRFSLLLNTGGAGLIAVQTNPPVGSAMAEISWKMENGSIVVNPGYVPVLSGGQFTWKSFSLRASDSDGDGVLDTGNGNVAGQWHRMLGDVFDLSDASAVLNLSRDRTSPTVKLEPEDAPANNTNMVTSRMRVLLSEPVAWDVAQRVTRVRAGASNIAGHFEPQGIVRGFVMTYLVVPDALPNNATLSMDLGDLADAAGNRAAWDGGALRTPPDVGSLLDNSGFESGLQHWFTRDNVTTAGRYEGTDPASGMKQAVIRAGGRIEGYLDVPATATTLTFSAAMLSDVGQFDHDRSGVVIIRSKGSEKTVFDAVEHQAQSRPCDCGKFRQRIAATTVQVDVTPYRGQRITIAARSDSTHYIGMTDYALLLDDFRLR